jgi:glutamate-ammonia-ligase adenylyltransferase
MVADIILEVMLAEVKREFARKHGVIEGVQFAIFALGKLGGRELTPTSDLDLVFIYDPGQAPPLSNGAKALSINHYFARLSQQFINALTAMTGEGKLYEVDMRLRPSGNAGPIAVTLQGFESYQKNDAWTWEHLALTRGRTIVADSEIGDKISQIVQNALKDSNRQNLLQDTADMREKLYNEFGTKDIWAVKHIRGGLVDIEFICQYLLLKYGPQYPEILVTNTLDQISTLKKNNILSDYNGNMLYHGCDFMQNLQAVLRLCLGDEIKLSENQQGLIDTLCERFDVDMVEQLAQKITEIQKNIYGIYREVIECPAEKS